MPIRPTQNMIIVCIFTLAIQVFAINGAQIQIQFIVTRKYVVVRELKIIDMLSIDKRYGRIEVNGCFGVRRILKSCLSHKSDATLSVWLRDSYKSNAYLRAKRIYRVRCYTQMQWRSIILYSSLFTNRFAKFRNVHACSANLHRYEVKLCLLGTYFFNADISQSLHHDISFHLERPFGTQKWSPLCFQARALRLSKICCNSEFSEAYFIRLRNIIEKILPCVRFSFFEFPFNE